MQPIHFQVKSLRANVTEKDVPGKLHGSQFVRRSPH